jgi:predicted molibdopterin-dependent oxidoreductase YjgC
MSAGRIGRRGGESFTIEFDGRPIEAFPGESVGAALIAAGIPAFRIAEDGTKRGPVCHIGVCWGCRCVIDGAPNMRACRADARPGMVVETQEGPG